MFTFCERKRFSGGFLGKPSTAPLILSSVLPPQVLWEWTYARSLPLQARTLFAVRETEEPNSSCPLHHHQWLFLMGPTYRFQTVLSTGIISIIPNASSSQLFIIGVRNLVTLHVLESLRSMLEDLLLYAYSIIIGTIANQSRAKGLLAADGWEHS